MPMERRIETAGEMEEFGCEIACDLAPGGVLALCGDLGAGKTCFVRGLVAGLGSPDPVASPTFPLVHEYPGGRLPVAHFDFYRVESADELVAAGWDDYLDRNGVVVAEWADRFPELLPPGTRWLEIERDGEARVIRMRRGPDQ
jgi:tRNA threonylcarbamoyladenosine biosynthesis protein TsaE